MHKEDRAASTTAPRINQKKRLMQLLRCSQIVLISVALIAAIAGRYHDVATLFITVLFLGIADFASRRNHHQIATHILLIGLTLMLAFIAWNSSGIHGVIPLGFSGILMFAAILGNRKQLIILFLGMAGTLLFIALSSELGLRTYSPIPITATTGIIMSIVLGAIGYCSYLIAKDYQTAVDDLELENTRIRLAKQKIEQLASHDSLTHLPNRFFAEKIFNERKINAPSNSTSLAVILIDLDNLKTINDSLGHQAGDTLLVDIAKRLSEQVLAPHFLSHYGGDEFIILFDNIQHTIDLDQFCESLLSLIAVTHKHEHLDVFCSCSIGVSFYTKDGNDFDTLLRKADIAMHHAKDAGRNSFYYYQDAHNQNLVEHLNMISDLRKGIKEEQFFLHYQPKIDLRNQRLTGFEALIRWQHPTQGIISPATFIPLAESSGLIIQLGEWTLRTVIQQIREWINKGHEDFTVAINISCVQLRRGNLDHILFDTLEQESVPAHFIELELTESLILDDKDKTLKTLSRLRRKGIHLSIDDFGTGYSNLGYLKKFEVESLKIDQSFIRTITHSTEKAAIVRAIIQMCHSLGLQSIAEGVETEETAALLRALGCTHGQGYLWSRPLAATDVEIFWREWQTRNTSAIPTGSSQNID